MKQRRPGTRIASAAKLLKLLSNDAARETIANSMRGN